MCLLACSEHWVFSVMLSFSTYVYIYLDACYKEVNEWHIEGLIYRAPVVRQQASICLICVLNVGDSLSFNIHNSIVNLLVPTPDVTVTAPNTQTVGQSLTLQCEVTTVRGITSGVDIVWRNSNGGMELNSTNDVSSTTMDNSLVYTDSYTISQLSTTDEGRVIQCEVVINASPSVMASDSITLDVTGE